ncbi:SCP2 sterol-binding domain-containing protein [Ectothiorhodospiraceae bacterium 2226]|nr:SCP2 sterol-binding domain-containing protein [Ectothiorhodospiraceae bacterium 2226]
MNRPDSTPWLRPAAQAVNAALRLDPAAPRRLARLAGKTIALELRGTPWTVYCVPAEGGLALRDHSDAPADARIRATPLTYLRLALSDDSTDLVFAGEVQVEGDVELGQRFQRLLTGLDIDWEERLAQLIGDVAAHQLMRAARATGAWSKATAHNLALDLGEYLQDETRLLPPRALVEDYLAAVDRTRSDVDRLEQRVRRLAQRLAGEDTP